GGGANAVANVRALGGEPLVAGIVGTDALGDRLLEIFDRAGIATGGIVRRQDYRTPCKTRVLGGARHSIKQQIVRFDLEDPRALESAERDALNAYLREQAARCEVAVLSDYGLGTVEPGFVHTVKQSKALQCLGDSRYRLQDFAGLDGATPNEEELESIEDTAEDDPARAGLALLERLQARFLLLTRGSEGMVLIDDEGALRIPCYGTSQVADVTGAGDTVIGTFALASAAGAEPREAAVLANYAGGTVVMKMGTTTATADELRQAVRDDSTTLEGITWDAW
ncbi:MAG: PfkB family carbohydrate kinase, partial [Acidobacteria bacterium]|nr:PfkB family carbohydrate kinase [Acidobacteriota bacterium]